MRVEIIKHGKKYKPPPEDVQIEIICPECGEIVEKIKESKFIKKEGIRVIYLNKNVICKKCGCEFIAKYK